MSVPRDWTATLADPAVVSDLFAAARDCMRQVCTDDPAECSCQANLMTPLEFVEWLESERLAGERDPVRFEAGHRPRQKTPHRMHLAAATG